jgi:hypothetical protein
MKLTLWKQVLHVNWIEVAQDRVQQNDFVLKVSNLRARHWREDNIKMDRKAIGCEDV